MLRLCLSILFLGLSLPAYAQSGGQAPPEVTVASPIRRDIVEDDEFVGRFEAVQAVDIRARVSGYLQDVGFREGSVVKKGDLLYSIDRRIFESALRQAEAQVASAQATFDFAKEQLTRAESLVGNALSQSALDERRQNFLSATAGLDQAKQALETAQINLDFSEVRAPITGRIDKTNVTPGNLVRADDTILTSIVATDPVYFYFDIDERYYLAYAKDARTRGSALQEGAGGLDVKVHLSDDAIPPFDGTLDFSENRIDAATGSMRVRAVVPNPDDILTPGLFGRVNVPGSLPTAGILIPDQAIVADQNRQLVMVVDAEGKVSPKPIRPGPRIDGYRVVREGLDGSELIVIEGLMRARPGAVVTPVKVDLPPVAAPDGQSGN